MSEVDLNIEFERYQRQTILPEVGQEGQAKLKNAKVLCIGAGGLGSPVLLYLAAAGVGTLGIMDSDEVALSNLHRQILFTTREVGKHKALMSALHLQELNPQIKIKHYVERLTSENALKRMQGFDVVIDATDNFSAKYLINDCAAKLGIPMVYGAIMGYEGQASVFWAAHGPCYRCLFPSPPKKHVPNCAEFGVLGALVGIIGSIQAFEVVKLILNQKALVPLIGKVAMFDGTQMQMNNYQLAKRRHCNICNAEPDKIKLQEESPVSCRLNAHSIKNIKVEELFLMKDSILIDVREVNEWVKGHIPHAKNLPLSELYSSENVLITLDKNCDYIIYCQHGSRSHKAAQIFMSNGFGHVTFLQGGFAIYRQTLEIEEV